MFGKQVVFELGGQLFSIDSLSVNIIEAKAVIQPLAEAPESIIGVVNLRGSIIPVCDMHYILRLPGKQGVHQMMFVHTADGDLGFYVDAVREIAVVDNDVQGELPPVARAASTRYVAGVIKHNNEVLTVINPDYLLSETDKMILGACLNFRNEEERSQQKELKRLEKQKKLAEEELRKINEPV